MTWTVTSDDPQVTISGKQLSIVAELEMGIVLVALVSRNANSLDQWQTAVMIDANFNPQTINPWSAWVDKMVNDINAYIATLTQPTAPFTQPTDFASLQTWLRTHLQFSTDASGTKLVQK